MIQADLFPAPATTRAQGKMDVTATVCADMPFVIERLATVSSRPRYAFMVLNLIARAAGQGGSAGPYVVEQGRAVRLRDWLCDALSPMAGRDPKRIALVRRVRAELEKQAGLRRTAKRPTESSTKQSAPACAHPADATSAAQFPS